MRRFPCPTLDGHVELTDEREAHICARHPDLLPAHIDELARTIAEPDSLVPAFVGAKRLFVRWAATIRGGCYVVTVVVTDSGAPARHWVVTAYLSRRAPDGD